MVGGEGQVGAGACAWTRAAEAPAMAPQRCVPGCPFVKCFVFGDCACVRLALNGSERGLQICKRWRL